MAICPIEFSPKTIKTGEMTIVTIKWQVMVGVEIFQVFDVSGNQVISWNLKQQDQDQGELTATLILPENFSAETVNITLQFAEHDPQIVKLPIKLEMPFINYVSPEILPRAKTSKLEISGANLNGCIARIGMGGRILKSTVNTSTQMIIKMDIRKDAPAVMTLYIGRLQFNQWVQQELGITGKRPKR